MLVTPCDEVAHAQGLGLASEYRCSLRGTRRRRTVPRRRARARRQQGRLGALWACRTSKFRPRPEDGAPRGPAASCSSRQATHDLSRRATSLRRSSRTTYRRLCRPFGPTGGFATATFLSIQPAARRMSRRRLNNFANLHYWLFAETHYVRVMCGYSMPMKRSDYFEGADRLQSMPNASRG